jgi:hypothetical protein
MKKANGFWFEVLRRTVNMTGLGIGALLGKWLWDITMLKLGIQ